MAKNINGQFTYAINNCFQEGMDKHSIKSNEGNNMGYRIYSYSEKFRVKEMGKMLQRYFKENDIKIRQVKDIKAEHIQAFLNSKIENCTQNTVNTYAQSIFKLQEVCNKTYKNCNIDWRDHIEIPKTLNKTDINRGVGSVIGRDDYDKILAYTKNNYSETGQAIRLQDQLGIRVEEIANIKIKNIDLTEGKIILENTKGGRVLVRELTPIATEIIRETLDKKQNNSDRLFSIKGSSINKQLNRIQDKLGIQRHSNHDIRRLIAQEYYDKARANGDSKKVAADKTSIWLNHNQGREILLKTSYIVIR